MGVELDEIFDNFDQNIIFKDKSYLQLQYKPSSVPHRGEQIKLVASILAPVLRGERTSNLFVYGNTGTGKTLSILYVKDALEKRMQKSDLRDFDLKIEYLNCKLKQVADTEYRILAALIEQLGGKVPSTGLPTQEVYSRFIDLIDSKKQIVVLILDEIDQIINKISNNFLSKFSCVAIISQKNFFNSEKIFKFFRKFFKNFHQINHSKNRQNRQMKSNIPPKHIWIPKTHQKNCR